MSLFAELGLRRYLNAEDTFTTNGASCMPPEVYRAMEESPARGWTWNKCSAGWGKPWPNAPGTREPTYPPGRPVP